MKKGKNQVIEGYNPKVYRNLSAMFVVLTIINIVIVFISFQIIGYGLYHAETALSCIANIDSNVETINKNVLEIVIHPDDKDKVTSNSENIQASYEAINKTADKFREIDLSNIDKTLPEDFDNTIRQITLYYNMVSSHLDDVNSGYSEADVLYNSNINEYRVNALTSIEKLFEKQDKATYDFFCKIAKRFLLVIASLLVTMAAGIYAIQKAKKRDKNFAIQIQESRMKTDHIRQKAKDLAYMNIVSGMQNRYSLEEELTERAKTDNVIIAMFSYNYFKQINENYGRNFADEFISEVFKKADEKAKYDAKLFHLENNELCVVFNNNIALKQAAELSEELLLILSNITYVQNKPIQLTVAGTIYQYDNTKENLSASKIIMTLDQGISKAKTICHSQNKSMLLPIN